MSLPIENYNYDNILVRNVIAGLLSVLNNNIKYDQVWDNNNIENVSLPWLYDLGSSDERMMQDNYTHFGQSCLPKKIDGNFDMFPRGAIRLESTKIDSDNICNRFVQGLTTKLENGKITTYHSYLYAIPLTLSFNCEIWCDNFSNMLKIEQGIREYLYRNKTFYVLFKGMKIGCCMGMPDDYAQQKNTEYSIQSETGEQKIKLTFSIIVETYHPVFDNSMEVPNEKRMNAIAYDVKYNDLATNKTIKLICDDVFVVGTESHIRWAGNSSNSDFCTVNLEYRQIKDKDGNLIDGERIPIVLGLSNQYEYYHNFSNMGQANIDIFFNEIENLLVLKEPKIKIYNNDVIILDKGYFITDTNHDVTFGIGYTDNNEYKIINDFGIMHIINSKLNDIEVINNFNTNDLSEYEIILSDGINNEVLDIKSGVKII